MGINKVIFSCLWTATLISSSLSADVFLYGLDTEFSGGDQPVGPTAWATASFSDAGSNTVRLEMSAANLTGGEFISGWYFNFDPSQNLGGLTFAKTGGTLTSNVTLSTGLNAFKADGDGFFDILLSFNKKGNLDRFTSGDTLTYEITSLNPINAAMFNFNSVQGGGNGTWTTAAHIQGIGPNGDGSGWVGADGPVVVPEPSTYLMLGSMLFVVALLKRRKKAYRT